MLFRSEGYFFICLWSLFEEKSPAVSPPLVRDNRSYRRHELERIIQLYNPVFSSNIVVTERKCFKWDHDGSLAAYQGDVLLFTKFISRHKHLHYLTG